MEIFYLCARNKIKITKNKLICKITKNKLICSRKETEPIPSMVFY